MFYTIIRDTNSIIRAHLSYDRAERYTKDLNKIVGYDRYAVLFDIAEGE